MICAGLNIPRKWSFLPLLSSAPSPSHHLYKLPSFLLQTSGIKQHLYLVYIRDSQIIRYHFISDKCYFSYYKGTDIRGRGMVLHYALDKVLSNEKLEVYHRADGLPGNLDPLLLPPFSLIITSLWLPLELEGTSKERCLCTTRSQWPPAASHSPCALKSYCHHPLLWNSLSLHFIPFKAIQYYPTKS